MEDTGVIHGKYQALADRLDEATLRLWAAVEARALGRGGVSMVATAIGMSRTTIYAGLEELEATKAHPASPPSSSGDSVGKRRIRAKGGGRKKLSDKDATLLRDLDAGRTDGARRSDVAVAVDMQEHASTGAGFDQTRASGQPTERL